MLPSLTLASLAEVRPRDALSPGGELPPQQIEQAAPTGSPPDHPNCAGARPGALHARELHGTPGKTPNHVQSQAGDRLEQLEKRLSRNRQQPHRLDDHHVPPRTVSHRG